MEHSGAPPPYMRIKFKKRTWEIQKKLEFWDIKPRCPIYSCEVSLQNTKKCIVGEKDKKKSYVQKKLFGWILVQTVFSSPRICFLVCFHVTRHGSRLGTKVWYPQITVFLFSWYFKKFHIHIDWAPRSSCVFPLVSPLNLILINCKEVDSQHSSMGQNRY